MKRSAARDIEQDPNTSETNESRCARIRRFRAKPQVEVEPAEDPRDTLLRKILGAQNRMWLMPFSNARAEFNAFCKQYRKRYGHLTIPTSLPLRLTRRPVLEDEDGRQDCQVLPFRKNSS
ncbi:MAG: hypothetical protein WC551_00840 [Patescibacteria group bacterium]